MGFCLFQLKMGLQNVAKSKIYRAFVAGSLILCIAGFTWNTFETIDKFISAAKLVLTESTESYAELPYPVFVFCNNTAYREIPSLNESPMWQFEDYINLTRNPGEIINKITKSTGASFLSEKEVNMDSA